MAKVKVQQMGIDTVRNDGPVFEAYVRDLPPAKNMREVDEQNKKLDVLESVLNGEKNSRADTSEIIKNFLKDAREVVGEELPFKETTDAPKCDKKEKEDYSSFIPQKEENREERFAREIREKYEAPYWDR